MDFRDDSPEELQLVMQQAWEAYCSYRTCSLKQRADLMRSIGYGLQHSSDALIEIAMKESHLPETRLKGELARTILQLNQYADACETGSQLDIRINTANNEIFPPKPDLRKIMVPLGPVVVFGASNFPFAYSTAGGDTACALAAGCPVVVKAHPAHPNTSQKVADLVQKAVRDAGLHPSVFQHVHGKSFETGKLLVTHPNTRAVGFTGSFKGGKQLFDWAQARKHPIPVFAEMGSVNPVFLFPEKMKEGWSHFADRYAESITLGVGQFCTNPGLIIGIQGNELALFEERLCLQVSKVLPAPMLHEGIASAYRNLRDEFTQSPGVSTLAIVPNSDNIIMGAPAILGVSADVFLDNPLLHREVFGPLSLIVRCKDLVQMSKVAQSLEGQITSTVIATSQEVKQHPELIHSIQELCGRFILNGVPTGVEVSLAMHHGGPFPASTDSRFSSVGADGIKRFTRPITFQNWQDDLLPDELKNKNSLQIWRTVNGNLTKEDLY